MFQAEVADAGPSVRRSLAYGVWLGDLGPSELGVCRVECTSQQPLQNSHPSDTSLGRLQLLVLGTPSTQKLDKACVLYSFLSSEVLFCKTISAQLTVFPDCSLSSDTVSNPSCHIPSLITMKPSIHLYNQLRSSVMIVMMVTTAVAIILASIDIVPSSLFSVSSQSRSLGSFLGQVLPDILCFSSSVKYLLNR